MGMVSLSVICHALFLTGAIFLPGQRIATPRLPSFVEVDLVSLPSSMSREPHGAKQSATRPRIEPKRVKPEKKPDSAPEKASSAKETVSLAPAKPLQVKRSLKKTTYNVSKAIDQAIAKIEKKVPESRSRSVLQAIDALKQKDLENTAKAAARGTGATLGEMGAKGVELLDIYHAEIWDLIRRNWAYSEELDRGRSNPEAVIIVKIMRNGEIRDVWFEERSGSNYFDDSCLKAIKKSDPLPPLPDGFLQPFHEVGFRFNPSELRRRP